MHTHVIHRHHIVLRVFLPFAFGYFLSYLFRVVNAVLAPDLTADLGLTPSQLGLLTATYFIAFASSQLPLGILLDRYGPRLIESGLLMFAGLGALIFARAQGLTGVILGRALIGFGVSACLMAAFKSYVIWFPRETLARINGFQMAAGGLGALTASTPVEWALGYTDWRGVFTILAVLSFLAGLAVFFLVPERKTETKTEDLSQQIKGVIQVLKSPVFWRIAPLTTLSQAGFIGIQGLWAGPWLRDVAGLDRHSV
ncbi:MAG: MFS transporter, partial [Desulfobacterales bacterium]|nr:MFS transporter [Desulfobacterales bacterium]